MSRCLFFTAVVLGTMSVATAEPNDLSAAASAAISEDAGVATAAIDRLRTAGPEGLAALIDTHRTLFEEFAAMTDRVPDARHARLKSALDAVGAQRDCHTAQLYWHTDLSAAIETARRESKPILSLRLLGKLTDEYSCANSRYFRTSLYANHEIGDYLRSHFVLHWQSERPVPRVTIDYGDGRKLERTLTGNSIHYVLDTQGRPFDALPGLYGPQAFLRELKQIEAATASAAALNDAAANAFVVSYHQQRLESIQAAWQRDLAVLKIKAPVRVRQPANVVQQVAVQKQGGGAFRAGERAAGKGAVENPMLNALAFNVSERFQQVMTDDIWRKLGALHQNDAVLDAASVALIRRENPAVATTDPQAGNPQSPEDALPAMIQTFQQAMAVDTVRNEYDLHRQLHEWFVAGIDRNLESLNSRVYAELFLTPRSDPWLGLVAPETYTGLANGGRVE